MSRCLRIALSLRLFPCLFLLCVVSPIAVLAQDETPANSAAETDTDLVESDPAAAAAKEAELLKQSRQLTFEGRRAGEGYYSQDGSLLVFQSEREPGNPFFQIYLMDLETGDVEQISPGQGKTTCAWVHPDNNRVLFSSTHEDPDAVKKQEEELRLRETGQERRYSWDYDPTYELYAYDRKADTYANLTNTEGYDAEGSYSPDGSLIAFASNREAYNREMTEREREMFELDPAYMMDIYIMNSDGSDVRKLTDVPGYDGGPFFSPDGTRICWRRFAENGATAEIFSMKTDGTDVRQLTHLGAMSWAPYYHPSGEYLVFATNIHGFGNFEMYVVDAMGKQEPQRVSYTAGFDGLPVFSPTGDQIAWTSNRTSSKQSQLFMANWDHQAARELLELDKLTALEEPTEEAELAASEASQSTESGFSELDVMRHVDYLCRKELGGRMTGTRGEKLATAYVASYLDSLGLVPAGDDGSWYQEFEFTSGVSLGAENKLSAGETVYELDKDWRPVSFTANGPVEASPVAFAGYGITAPATDEFEEYDSFVHLDVKDKWVVIFRYMPEQISAEMRQHLNYHSSLRYKAMSVRDKGAKGLILVSGPTSRVRSELIPLRMDGSVSGTSIPVISITDEVAETWLKGAGKSLRDLQVKLDSGDLVMGFDIPDLELAANIELEQVKTTGRNVIGRLQMGEEPAAEAVMLGAHIDHLGAGASGSSLARTDEVGGVHWGADDNASGVAGLLEIAQYLASQKKAGKLPAKRDILFAAWSGEELGTLGSAHFTRELLEEIQAAAHAAHAGGHHQSHGHEQPKHEVDSHSADAHSSNAHGTDTHAADSHQADEQAKKDATQAHGAGDAHAAAAAHAAVGAHGTGDDHGSADQQVTVGPIKKPSLSPTIVAYLNMDMIGRLRDNLVLQGIGSSSVWRSEIERRNAPVGLSLVLQDDCYLPTDATEFYTRGVPILAAFTGQHEDYHTPRDTPDKLNYPGTAKVSQLMGLIARSLALRETPPEYLEQEAEAQDQRRANLRAWLGSVPEYGTEDVTGVPLSGVTKNGPADKAGVQTGDVIVELAGRKIENIYDYTYAIEALKIGQTVKIAVERNGKRIEMEITPGSRE